MYGRDTLYSDKGYIVYNIHEDKSAYVHQIYIKPEYRRTGAIQELEDIIRDKHDVEIVACFVDLKSKNPEQSLMAILSRGYKILSVNTTSIELFKEL